MTSRLVDLSFDANDPPRLAQFWAEALGWRVGAQTDDDVRLVPSDGTTFGIVFRHVRELKTAKNSIHLDLTTSSLEDQTQTVEQLLRLGAGHIDVGQGPDDLHVVLADPEGNEFCLIEPTNRFLAGRGRLGSITCDGSVTVGHFWSAVLQWPLFWDQDEETAICTPDGSGPFITWGPPVPTDVAKNRLHLEIAPVVSGNEEAEADRLVALGATRIDTWRMADPDGNEFWLLGRR